ILLTLQSSWRGDPPASRRWRADVWDHRPPLFELSAFAVVIAPGTPKGHQRRFLVTIQEQKADQRRGNGIGAPSRAVDPHHIFKRGEASVMHVWGRPCTVAQRRRTKRAPISPDPRNLVATDIGKSAKTVANAQIVEPKVRQ